MIRKILCSTDLTAASEDAVRAAVNLAKQLGAPLVLLHVVEPAYYSRAMFAPFTPADQEFLTGIARREQEAAIRLMNDQVAALNPPGGDAVQVETTVRRGVPSDVIVEACRELNVDLLVVGTHARSGIRHALLGSVAERLVRTAPCKVLVARGKVSG
jgi:nucleotide-binding universal stress UspA family protein